MTQINSIEELMSALNKGQHDFFISNGILKSSKYIELDENDNFYIVNEIDDSEQTLNEEELFNRDYTNIGFAIENGQFYMY